MVPQQRSITKLKLVRLQLGVAQLDIAAAAGLSQTRLSLIECGRYQPRSSELEAIARALNVPIALIAEPGQGAA